MATADGWSGYAHQTHTDPGLHIARLGGQLTMILDLNPPILDDEL